MKRGWLQIFLWLFFPIAISAAAQTWTPTGSSSNQWGGIAISADGTRIIANLPNNGPNGGLIYHSTNAGVSWSLLSQPARYFFGAIAASADGNQLLATDGNWAYSSTNAGTSWQQISDPDLTALGGVASSGDGQKFAAIVNSTKLYTSTNSGATWALALTVPLIEKTILSADGGTLAAWRAIGDGSVYTSTNFGAAWTTNTLEGYLASLACSADGKKMTGVAMQGAIFTSTNSGLTWSTNSNVGNFLGYAGISSDGDQLIALPYNSSNHTGYRSADPGVTWTSFDVTSNQTWVQVVFSADANEMYSTPPSDTAGFINVLQFVPAPVLNLAVSKGNLALSWPVPSTNFVLQSSADLSTWTDATNQPVFNLTNLQQQISLRPSDRNRFFRLSTAP